MNVNRTLSLIRYAAVDGKGWRRGPAVLTKNGHVKPNVMLLGGVEIDCPNGRYQIVRYEDRRPVYTDLGNDPKEALRLFRAAEGKLQAQRIAEAAGLQVVTEDDPTRKTLKAYAADFLAMHRALPHRSDDSVRVYTQITESFLAATKARYADDVTKKDVIDWHSWMRTKKKYSDRTASDRYTSLRGFLRYCGIDPDQLIPQNIDTLLKKYTRKKVNTYTPETVQKLIDASTDDDRALLWDFAYKTGLRDSELQMVTRYDLHGLDTDAPMLHVKERDDYGQIKDSEERKIELHPSLAAMLKQWLKDNPRKVLVFGTSSDKPDTQMLRALKVTARRAGLNCGHCKGCKGKNNECREFTLHRFRRTYTTRMLRASGGDLRSVMERTGHSDLASVMRYLEPQAEFRMAVERAF